MAQQAKAFLVCTRNIIAQRRGVVCEREKARACIANDDRDSKVGTSHIEV